MIYPVLCYHDGSYRTCNTAVNMGFRQAVQWFHQSAAELPPLLQYRSFVHPENGVYGALLTTAEPFADRDGRNTPTKIMLILDGAAAAELMEDPRRIPALAACMRERLADPGGACAMDKLPDLSCWMERQKATDVQGEEVDLICRAVHAGMEGKRQICCVTDRWETLLAALQELPVSQRCRTAFSVGWRKSENADFFDVIVADAETAAAIRPRTKRIWTKENHDPVQDAFSTKQEKLFSRPRRRMESRPHFEKYNVTVIPKHPEELERPKRRRVRVGRILRTLLLMAAAAAFLLLNGSGYLSDLGRVYIQLTFDGNDLINAVLLVLLGYLLGKLCCEVEVEE